MAILTTAEQLHLMVGGILFTALLSDSLSFFVIPPVYGLVLLLESVVVSEDLGMVKYQRG